MAATAALSAAAVADIAARSGADVTELTIALAIVTGVCGLIAGLIRLGFLASFISEPVLKGFIIGLALTIIVGQLPHIFGVEGSEGDFFEKAWDLITHLGRHAGLDPARGNGVARASCSACDGSRRVSRARWWRSRSGSPPSRCSDSRTRASRSSDRSSPGSRRSACPTWAGPTTPRWPSSAIGILLVGFGEGLAAAKTYATKEHYPIDPNRELIGLGAANLGAGLSSGMVVAGSLSKTAVNGSAGARTQASGLIVAVLTIVTLLFLTGLFENLPEATLAAVVIAAVIELVDYRPLARLYRLYTSELGRIYGLAARADLIAAVAALLGVLDLRHPARPVHRHRRVGAPARLPRSRPHVAVLGKQPGTHALGRRRSAPRRRQPPTTSSSCGPRPSCSTPTPTTCTPPSATTLTDGTRAVVLDLESVPAIDFTATEMLRELDDELDEAGASAWDRPRGRPGRRRAARSRGAASARQRSPSVERRGAGVEL